MGGSNDNSVGAETSSLSTTFHSRKYILKDISVLRYNFRRGGRRMERLRVDSASTRCLRGTGPRIIESRRGAKGAIGLEEPTLWTTSSPCTQYLSVGGFRNLGNFGDFPPDSQRGSGVQRLHPHALGSGLTLGLSVPAWRGDISRATMGIVV